MIRLGSGTRIWQLIVAASALSALQPIALRAQRATEAIDAKVRADCRLATQALSEGHPAPKWDWAMGAIVRCEQTGGPTLAELWLSTTIDSTALAQLVRSSRRLADGRLFEVLLAVAADGEAGWARRTSAMRVLASFVWPELQISDANLRALPDSINPIGHVDHPAQIAGAVPLPADANARVRALLLSLASDDPDPAIRHAAAFTERNLRPRF